MHKKLLTVLAPSLLLLSPMAYSGAHDSNTASTPTVENSAAINTAPKAERHGHWKKMSPEQRQQLRQKWLEKWQNMSPEQKEKMQQHMMKRYQSATPEEQAVMKEKFILKFKSFPEDVQQSLLNQLQPESNQ